MCGRRLEEAISLVKSTACRKNLHFQAGALNSLVRALSPDFIDSALELLSFVRSLNLLIHRDTLVALISACAKHSLIEEAYELYW